MTDAGAPIRGTGIRVTELGFGGASIVNLYHEISAEGATAAMDAAWAGIRYFDTAPHHGFGLSEERLRAALRDRPAGVSFCPLSD